MSRSHFSLFKLSFCRLVVAILVFFSITGYAAAGQESAHAASPGTPIVAIHAGTGGTLSNHAIAATWHIQNGKLTGLSVENAATRESLTLAGPFSLALQDGTVLEASSLTPGDAARVEKLVPETAASTYAQRLPGTAVHYALTDPKTLMHIDWALVLREGSPYVRQVLTLTAAGQDIALSRISMVDVRAPGIAVAGAVKGSPLVAGDFFLGLEHPLSQSSVVGSHGVAEIGRAVPLKAGESVRYSAVVGVAAPGQMRRGFLAYLERERAHPYRTFLHYNSWYDIGYFNPYSQAETLDRINAFGQQLHVQRGVTLDSFLFDDGWDDHTSLWNVRKDFKDGFLPLKEAAAKYGTAPGVWLSPVGRLWAAEAGACGSRQKSRV